jgi:Ca-activated chloride channel family protein
MTPAWPITIAYPWWLLLLALLPLLAWLKSKRGSPPAFVYSSVQPLRGIMDITRVNSGGLLTALRWLALILMILALARIRLTHSETKITASGIDIVVSIDMSRSMLSEDFEIGGERLNRLAMAKEVVKKFIEKRPSDRIGLVAFATEAYMAAPLTLDHDYLLQNLDRLEIGDIDDTQTAIGSGLATALNRLGDIQAKSKIVILMTDGQNNAGAVAPLTVAEAAQTLKVKVYTIGVGMRGLAPFPVFMGRQKVGYQQQPVDIDEDTLKKIAALTGGEYYRADNAERFQQIYAQIDKLEKTEASIKKLARHKELFPWLIATALALALFEAVLRHTVYRRLP